MILKLSSIAVQIYRSTLFGSLNYIRWLKVCSWPNHLHARLLGFKLALVICRAHRLTYGLILQKQAVLDRLGCLLKELFHWWQDVLFFFHLFVHKLRVCDWPPLVLLHLRWDRHTSNCILNIGYRRLCWEHRFDCGQLTRQLQCLGLWRINLHALLSSFVKKLKIYSVTLRIGIFMLLLLGALRLRNLFDQEMLELILLFLALLVRIAHLTAQYQSFPSLLCRLVHRARLGYFS